MELVLVLPDGTRKVRKADWFESFGNFAAISFRYQGKRYRGLPKSESGFDTRAEGEDMRPYVWLEKSAGYVA
jgi:phage-related protein